MGLDQSVSFRRTEKQNMLSYIAVYLYNDDIVVIFWHTRLEEGREG